jgi:hypothetical protein
MEEKDHLKASQDSFAAAIRSTARVGWGKRKGRQKIWHNTVESLKLYDTKTDHLRIEDMDHIVAKGCGLAVLPSGHGRVTVR